MKEIHKIYLVCLVILILFCIIYFNKEHFENLFEQQTTELLQVSPQENEKSCNKSEGLYVIECPFLREDKDNKKKIYLYIDDKKLEEELPFGFRNSLDLEPKDIDNKDRIAIRDKGSNLRIDNGIFIDSENDTFKFRKLYYTKDSDSICPEKIANNFCKGEYLQNFKIIQFYDNVEPNNKDIKYFIKHDDKYLYVDYKDGKNDEYEIKKLEMSDICHTEGDTYRYLFDDISYGEENIDKNTLDDNEFNRSYTDIPEKDMCPINFPFACSDDINWRNKCSKNQANTDGKCEGGDIITSKDNKPMRNFNCHGFKCYNNETTIPVSGEWDPQETDCKIPTNRFAKKNIKQFLFNINAFKCEVKEGTTGISELSFCHSHPKLERKQAKNIPFFDKVVIVNEGETPTTEGAIKIEGIKNLKLSSNENLENLYDLYAIESNEQNGIKEGITEFKIVGPEENCSEIPNDNTTFPSKWNEAQNESKIIGCYYRNNIFDFEKDSIEAATPQDKLDICKNNAKKNYYGFQPLDSNGNCLESDTVPFLPRDKNFKDCASSDENINGLCNGKICGYTTTTNVNKIAIYKNIKEGDEQSNIKNNRVYHNFSYKIFNKSAGYMYKWDKGFLNTTATTNDNISDKIGDPGNTDTFIKIVRVSGVDNQTPICYNEPIHLRFTINKEEKTLKANPIKGHDRTYILHENEFLNADIDNRITSNHTLRRRGAVESYTMTFPEGYNIKKTTEKEDTGKFYFFSTDKEGSMREEDNSRGDRRAIKQKDYKHDVINYHGNCLKHNIPTDREDASDTKVGKYDDVNQKSNPDSYEEIKIDCGENNNVDFVTSQLKTSYFGGFHKLINKEDTIKEGNEYYIYSTITEYFKYIASHDDGNSYIRQVRGILNKDFSNVSHFNTDHKIKLRSDINDVPRKNNKKEIFPSSINKYNIIETNKNISFVKTDNNFCFTTNTELEELEFKIVKMIGSEVSDRDTFDDKDYIDIGKDNNRQKLYLYNDLYNFYLTINTKDTNKNSVIYYDGINKKNVNKLNCQLNMVMAKNHYNIPQELKKICYKTTPHQTIDITKINMNMGKTCSTGIRMNENKLLSNYSFCTKQEESSQDLNNSFNPATYVNSNPYKPYPIPEKL